MNNLFRAIRIAAQYPFTIAGAVVCSFLVASLWGANIGAVYPIVEVVFQGESMKEWVDKEIANSETTIADLKVEQAELTAKIAAAKSPAEELNLQLGKIDNRLSAERQTLSQRQYAKPMIDRYMPEDPFTTLVYVVIFLLVGTTIKVLFLAANIMLVERLGQRTAFELRTRTYSHMLDMELATHQGDHSSALTSRIASDTYMISAAITTLFGKTLREPLKMIACLIGAAFISWRLLAVSLLFAPLAVYLMYLLARSIKRASRRTMEEMQRVLARLSETFTAVTVVKAFTMEQYEKNRFFQTAHKLYKRTMHLAFYNALVRFNNELLGVGVICLAILAGGYLVLNQETHLLGLKITDRPLSFGSIMLFYAFLVGVSDPARKLADVYHQLQGGAASADRIFPLLDRKPTIVDIANPQPAPALEANITFHNIDFSYKPNEPVLRGVDLTINQGETIAIVGPNGCGKSTLVNLLPRFYDVASGSITIDGVDLRHMRRNDLRQRMSIVSQQTILFDESILENIRYGSPDATDLEVIAASKKAHAHGFIESKFDQGYETVVGEGGAKLSGGQRQRIALARAILRNPALLILDEATSQIDPESEQLIHQALGEFVADRTAIMITHRLTTLDLADRIIVMDAGKIVDSGSHADLMKRCATYQRLYASGFHKSA